MLNRGSLDVQHRANQSNRRRNLTDPGNSPQTAEPGAAEQIEQHGFALVLRVVCRRNQVQVTLLRDRFKKRISCFSGGLFKAAAGCAREVSRQYFLSMAHDA